LPEARRSNGLSVAATIEQYELREIDDPQNFHAVILKARLDEILRPPRGFPAAHSQKFSTE
jgi:hypothetical protein